MSDYYYLNDDESEFGNTPILGDDYIRALRSIIKKHGIKVTDKMLLQEIFRKTKRETRRKSGI